MKGKQDNAFVFVALRGPERPQPRPNPSNPSTPQGSTVPVPIDPGENVLVDRIRRLADAGGDLQESRTAVATEFMRSTSYVPRNPSWRRWLVLEHPITTLLARAGGPDDTSSLRDAFEQLLSRHFGRPFDIGEFAAGDEFRQMHADLWSSYYANVALRTRRAQDLPTLEFWIKVFEVIKNLGAEWAPPSLAGIEGMRLTVPFLLVQEKRLPPDAPDEPTPPSRRQTEISQAKSALADLKAAESELKGLLQSRVALAHARDSITAAQVLSVKSRAAGGALDDPPEQLTISSSELSAGARTALVREHVDTASRPLPSIIDTVQRKIAQAYLRLHDLQRVTEVVLSNGVFVRRRRISIDRASEEAR